MKKTLVVILGNDHTNCLGVAQSLGVAGYNVVAAVWGRKTGLLSKCKYVCEVISGRDAQICIEHISKRFANHSHTIPIIACCDGAAVALEKNKKLLGEKFLFEHTRNNYSLRQLATKKLQVELAQQSGFNVPKSLMVETIEDFPSEMPFNPPYIIKALVSMEGSKNDLIVCRSYEELKKQAAIVLQRTYRILIQQYIERDYEISILGCGRLRGDCIAPAIEYKLTLHPKNVGLECLAYVDTLTEENDVKQCINTLIDKIGYVGLFSVELMHCKADGKYYFTEVNLRNDGANAFILKSGVNLPAIHVADLFGENNNVNTNVLYPGYYLWEMHHFLSLLHREISLVQWLKEIKMSRGFLTYFKDNRAPFYKQFSNYIKTKLHLLKPSAYE